jgi:hypothetical protein
MPGLIRGVARTAVIAGTATAVSKRVSRRQYNHWAEGDTQQSYQSPPQYEEPPPPAASADEDRIAQLKDLADLTEQGFLTGAEFAAEQARILQQ